MLKILSQDEKEVFDVEKTNMFVCGNKILISDKVNIYESKAALLGMYNDEEEAQDVLFTILETFTATKNLDSNFYCAKMPKMKNIEGKEKVDGGEQGETGENNKI